jgi:hypothetical protein
VVQAKRAFNTAADEPSVLRNATLQIRSIMYANIFTQTEVSTLPQLAGRVNCTWENSREEYLYDGWRKITNRTAIPDGATITGTRYEQDPDFICDCRAVCEFRTTEQAADDEAKRLVGLVSQHRAAIAELAGLLSVFNQPFPVPESVAEKAVYEQTKTDHGKAADGVMLMRRYGQLVEALGADLMAVITLVKGGA